MATINDLTTSVSEMSDEDLFEHIKEVRKYRRTPVIKKKKANKATKSKASKVSVDTLVSKLSPSEIQNLIDQLERG